MNASISYRALLKLHLWQFARQRANIILLCAFLLLGCYGLFQGYAVKNKMATTITAFVHEKDSAFQKIKAGLDADTSTKEGKAAFREASNLFILNYGINLPVDKTPSGTSMFNIGQSDVYPYYYIIRPESFIMQLFKQTEIVNPLRSLTGHFDMTFWIVYLMPLLVLLLCFNILSTEMDNSNWKLIKGSGINENKWLLSRLYFSAVLIAGMLLILFIAGLVINIISFSQFPSGRDFLFLMGALSYLILWMSVFYFINALKQNTGYNALVSGLTWIAVCIVLPAVISKCSEIAVPVDNTLISTFSRRPQDTRIDEQKGFAASLITSFAATHPLYRWSDTVSTKPSFQSRVYRAWHTSLDEQKWPVVQDYYEAIKKRQFITNTSIVINPAGGTDGLLAGIAGNDVNSQYYFLLQCLHFHEQLRAAVYPALFADKSLTKQDYNNIPFFHYQPAPVNKFVYAALGLMLLLSLVFYLAGNKKLQREV